MDIHLERLFDMVYHDKLMRMMIWKQWKIPKKQKSSLVKLGIPLEEANELTFCRKGYNFSGHSKVVQRA